MQLPEFAALSEKEQLEVLRTQAVYLAKRKEHNLVHFLYQLHNFYVEVPFHPRCNKTGPTRCFQSMQLLDPYLAQMRVKHIS